jgi:uncharacterized membrane protein (Fun14 family)
MFTGDDTVNIDVITSVSATIGGGFFEGLLLGYALKKIVKIVAVVVGLFIAGLAYLQYHQIALFDWNRIERLLTSTLGNITSQISNSQKSNRLSIIRLWFAPDKWYVSYVRNRIYEGLMAKCSSIKIN